MIISATSAREMQTHFRDEREPRQRTTFYIFDRFDNLLHRMLRCFKVTGWSWAKDTSKHPHLHRYYPLRQCSREFRIPNVLTVANPIYSIRFFRAERADSLKRTELSLIKQTMNAPSGLNELKRRGRFMISAARRINLQEILHKRDREGEREITESI